MSIYVACEQALLFGRAKPASRERASETHFTRRNRRACSQASIYVIEEDCVIGCVGRWYKLDFELMSLCPRCFCFLLFIPCMSNFIVLSLFSSSLRFHFFLSVRDAPN